MIDRLADLVLKWALPRGEPGEEVRTDLAREADERTQGRPGLSSSLWRFSQALGIAIRYSLYRMRGRDVRRRRRRPMRFLQGTLQDVHFGFRVLRRRPLFALVSVTALGLGIGATTTVFSVMDGVLFPDIPFREPHDLVNGWPSQVARSWEWYWAEAGQWYEGQIDYDGYLAWRDGSSATEDVSIYAYANETLWTGEGPEEVEACEASPAFLSLLGLRPLLGRWFLRGESGRDFRPVDVKKEIAKAMRGGSQSAVSTPEMGKT